MKRILALSILAACLSSQAFAVVDSIKYTASNPAGFTGDTYLAYLRWQVLPLSAAGRVAVICQSTSADIQISDDSGATFGTTYQFSTFNTTDHAHGSVMNDTIQVAARNTGSTQDNRHGVMNLTGTGTVVLKDGSISAGIDCAYSSKVCGVIRLGGIDIATWRGGDCQFQFGISNDLFTTQTTGYVADYSALGDASTRMGQGYGLGTVYMTAWLDYGTGSNDTIDIWWFDPSDSTWARETNPPLTGNLSRFWAANTFMNDTAVMVTTWLGANEDTLVAAWRTMGQTTWHRDTVWVSGSATASPGTALTYIENSNLLVMFYTNDNDLLVRTIGDDLTWSGPTTLMADTTIGNNNQIAIAQKIPASHGDKAYVAIYTGSTQYFLKVNFFQSEEAAATGIRSIGGSGYGGTQW